MTFTVPRQGSRPQEAHHPHRPTNSKMENDMNSPYGPATHALTALLDELSNADALTLQLAAAADRWFCSGVAPAPPSRGYLRLVAADTAGDLLPAESEAAVQTAWAALATAAERASLPTGTPLFSVQDVAEAAVHAVLLTPLVPLPALNVGLRELRAEELDELARPWRTTVRLRRQLGERGRHSEALAEALLVDGWRLDPEGLPAAVDALLASPR